MSQQQKRRVSGREEIHQEVVPLLPSLSTPTSPAPAVLLGRGTVVGGKGGMESSLASSFRSWNWFQPSRGASSQLHKQASDVESQGSCNFIIPPEAPQPLRRHALTFDGEGNCRRIPWVVGPPSEPGGPHFNWYHIEVPRSRQRASNVARSLIEVLCPPLSLQEILGLVSNGPFCGLINGNLIFRNNSSGPVHSKYTLKMAMCISDTFVVSVGLGRIPRLEFSDDGMRAFCDPNVTIQIERDKPTDGDDHTVPSVTDGKLILKENVLEFLLTMNHSNEADNPIPNSVPELINHIIDTYVDQIQDLIIRVEVDLDNIERDIDTVEGYKRKLLDDHKLPKLHLSLQRILQVVSHAELMTRKLREKVVLKKNFKAEDVGLLDTLLHRLIRLKDNIGFLLNRNSALQGGLDTWQSEQINNKLYILSVLSIIFLPLSIITGAFGMNIGGVPWVTQPDPDPYVRSGWRNVMILCGTVVVIISTFFFAGPVWDMIATRWRRHRALRKWKRAVKLVRQRSVHQRLQDASLSGASSIPCAPMTSWRSRPQSD